MSLQDTSPEGVLNIEINYKTVERSKKTLSVTLPIFFSITNINIINF